MIELAQDTELSSYCEGILRQQAIPLVNILPYSQFHNYFVDFMAFHLKNAHTSGALELWDGRATTLLRHVYRTSSAWSSKNDAFRLHLLMDLYTDGHFPYNQHVALFRLTFNHVRRASKEEVQKSFCRIINNKTLTGFFSRESTFYNSESVKLRVLREILENLFLWFMEEEPPSLELQFAASSWYYNPRTIELCRTDPKFRMLSLRVREKLSVYLATQLEDLSLDEKQPALLQEGSSRPHRESARPRKESPRPRKESARIQRKPAPPRRKSVRSCGKSIRARKESV